MSNEIVQITFDDSVLTQEQAKRTQEAEIRIIGRTQKAIIDNGKDLLAVKADIGHGNFLNWVQTIGISPDTAQRWMNVAENFREIPQSAVFDKTALYLLSSSGVPEAARQEAKNKAASGVEITEEIARQIRDAHKAKEQAEKAERIALQEAAIAQSQLFQLEQKMATLVIPKIEIHEKEIIKEVIPEAVKEQIAQYKASQEKIQKLTYERDNEAARANSFAKKFQEDLSKQKEEEAKGRTRQRWRSASTEFQSTLNRWYSQWPTALDLEVFEGEDWARLENAERRAQRFIQDCQELRQRNTTIVDAG